MPLWGFEMGGCSTQAAAAQHSGGGTPGARSLHRASNRALISLSEHPPAGSNAAARHRKARQLQSSSSAAPVQLIT